MRIAPIAGCIVLSSIIVTGCSISPNSTTDHADHDTGYTLTIGEYHPITDADVITVNNSPITLSNRLSVGSVLADIPLDKPVGEFDKIEQIRLSSLSGYTMIYSVPSLDTPVCTLQTKQIEAASAEFPQHNFVIVSHDTPFALDRFCTDKNITNILTLSDARDTSFARKNGLYMEEYRLMTRAIIIINEAREVLYVDYADEVTGEVDLINAFAYLDTQLPDTTTTTGSVTE